MKRARQLSRRERRAIAFSPRAPRSVEATSTPAGTIVTLGPCVLPEGHNDAEAFLRWIANDVASKSDGEERGALSVASFAAKLLREFKGCVAEDTMHVAHLDDGRWIFIGDENRLIGDEVELDEQIERIARQPTIVVTAEEVRAAAALCASPISGNVSAAAAASTASPTPPSPGLRKAGGGGKTVSAA